MSTETEVTDRLIQATVKAEKGSDVLDDFVNLPVGSFITTDSGNIPSLAEWLASLGNGISLIPPRVDALESNLKNSSFLVVATLSDLKAIPKGSAKYAATAGYLQKGDGGWGLYYQAEATTAQQGNDFTQIVSSDGALWKLNFSGMPSILQAGAKGDGVRDNYSALMRAHAGAPCVYAPSGTYVCSQEINLFGAHGLVGDGVNKTKILFSGATKGYKVSQTYANDGFNFDKFTLLTNTTSDTTVGLLIDGSPQMGTIFDGFRYILANRNYHRGYVGDIGLSGVDNNSGWGVGFQAKSLMNWDLKSISYSGYVPPVAGDLKGVAVLINGDGAPTDMRLGKIWSFYSKYVCLMPDYVEGVHIDNVEAVPTTYGIIGKYTAPYSVLPEASAGCLGVFLGNIHINCLQAGIDLRKSNACKINKIDIALQTRAADAASVAIYLQGGNYHKISDVTMSGDAAANTKLQNRGLVLDQIGRSHVSAVSATSLESSVKLIGSSNNRVVDSEAYACANVVNGDSGSTGNRVEGYDGAGNSGVSVSVALDNNVVLKEHSANRSIALSGGASANISFPLPAGLFSEAPTAGFIAPNSGSAFYNYQYLRASSTATLATFFLGPVSPATTLPTGAVEFSLNVKGK